MGLIGWLVSIGCCAVGVAAGLWGLTEVNKTLLIWFVGVPGAACLVIAAGLEFQNLVPQNASTPPGKEQQIAIPDIPVILPVDIGIIRVRFPNGVTAQPHVQFRIKNYGKANAVLRRITAKFAMIELPLTKEKAAADNVRPGQTQVSQWENSSVLAPGDSIETDAFTVPDNIKIENYQGRFGRPKVLGPEQLFLFITIEYEDLAGNGWIGRTCWKYQHPSNGSLIRYDGKEWNYEEKQK